MTRPTASRAGVDEPRVWTFLPSDTLDDVLLKVGWECANQAPLTFVYMFPKRVWMVYNEAARQEASRPGPESDWWTARDRRDEEEV